MWAHYVNFSFVDIRRTYILKKTKTKEESMIPKKMTYCLVKAINDRSSTIHYLSVAKIYTLKYVE